MLAIAPLQARKYSSLVLAPLTSFHRSRYMLPLSSGSGSRTTFTRPDSNASYTEKSDTSHSKSVPSGLGEPEPYQGVADRSSTRLTRAAFESRSRILLHLMYSGSS